MWLDLLTLSSSQRGSAVAGITTVSGHTHLLDVKAWGDYRGRRYGIQTGCVADLESASMEYAENNPSPACPGFVVLTFCNGRLLYPELKAVDSILAGDGDYPANWQRILDVCRQEVAGDSAAAPYLFWGIHND